MTIGKLERAILQAIYDLGAAGIPAYSLTIRQRLEEQKAVGFWTGGSFYIAIGALEAEAYTVGTPESRSDAYGGLPRRRYELTGHGLAEVNR